MDVFLESNFLLQLTFRQENYSFCEQILRGAGPESYTLHVPQYALTEVFQKLRPLRNKREEYQKYLVAQVAEYLREEDSDASTMDDFTRTLNTLLSARTKAQTERLYTVAAEMAQFAPGPSLTAAIIQDAFRQEQTHRLSPQDALVYASVLAGLRELPPGLPKLFVTTDEDFNTPPIRQELQTHQCDLLTNFQAAAGRLRVV